MAFSEHTPLEDEVARARREELQCAVEALVFAADEPLSARDITAVWSELSGEATLTDADVADTVAALNARYADGGHALRIVTWAGGYRLTTIREAAPYLKAYFKKDRHRRLSRALMETLAILAYRQPATKPEVDFVRGVDSDYALRKLMEYGLAAVVGRSDAVGRPLLYGTTAAFLEAFGLPDLDALPNLREVEELLDDPAFNSERARLLMLHGLTAPDEPTEDDHSQPASDGATPTRVPD